MHIKIKNHITRSSIYFPSSLYSSYSSSESSMSCRTGIVQSKLSSSKSSSYFKFLRKLSLRLNLLFPGQWLQGGSRGSRPSLREFQTIVGMIRVRTGQLISRQGLKLISISQGLNSLSIMKSKPKISKLHSRLDLSMTLKLALMTSRITDLILGTISL